MTPVHEETRAVSGRNVAVLSAFPPAQDGIAHYAGEVFAAYARQNARDRLRVFTRSLQPEQVLPTPPNLKVVTVPGGNAGRIVCTTSMRQLLPAFRDFAPDVAHLQGAHIPLYGGIWGEPVLQLVRGLRKSGVPVVHTVHSTWLPDDIAKLLESKRLPGSARRGLLRYYGWFWRSMATELSQMRLATAGSKAPILAEFIAAWDLGGRCEIVPEPHPCSGAAHGRGGDPPPVFARGGRCIAAVGFVRPDKNYQSLLAIADELLDALPDAWILIAGQPSGPEGQACAAEMHAAHGRLMHRARVHLMLEYVPDDELHRYFMAADVVVIPYTRVIGPSGPVHHALSNGKAVAASALGHNLGLRGTIELFNPRDPQSLLSTLIGLFSMPGRIAALEAAATAYARQHTWEQLAREYSATYQRLASTASRDHRRSAHGTAG